MNENKHLRADMIGEEVRVSVYGSRFDVLTMCAELLDSLLNHGISLNDILVMVMAVLEVNEAPDADAVVGPHATTCSEAYKAKIAEINNSVHV